MRRDKSPNWDFFRKRLEDPSLLQSSVPIVYYGRAVELAVPIGGKRRGGYVALPTLRCCRETVRKLKGNPGFPNLRIIDGRPRRCGQEVEWGDPQPDDDAERGRYFGYSEQAIREFLKQIAKWDAQRERPATNGLL